MADLIVATHAAAVAAVGASFARLRACVVQAAAPPHAWKVESGGEVQPAPAGYYTSLVHCYEAKNPHGPTG